MSADEEFIDGRIRLEAGRVLVRLERVLEHSPEAVWNMLTDSVHLASWLAAGSLDAREGGRVQLDFGNSGMPIDCTITACRPHRLLSFSWSSGDAPERPLTWELLREGVCTRL